MNTFSSSIVQKMSVDNFLKNLGVIGNSEPNLKQGQELLEYEKQTIKKIKPYENAALDQVKFININHMNILNLTKITKKINK